MTRARALMSDTVALAFGSMAGRLIGLLLLPLYTYTLSRSQFGAVELITTAIDLAVPVLFLCLSEGALRFLMSPDEVAERVVFTALVFLAAGTALIWASAAIAALWLSPVGCALIAAVLSLQATSALLGAWARASGRVRSYAASGVAQAIAVAGSSAVFLLYLDLGVAGYLMSLCVGLGVGIGVLAARLPINTAGAGSFDRMLLGRMLSFSAPLVPNVALWWMTNLSGRFFLAYWSGVGAVGLFGVATRISAILVMATTIFSQAWQLAANRSTEIDDRAQREEFYSSVLRFYIAFLAIAMSSVLVALRPLIDLVASPEFFDSWRIVPPLMGGAVFAALSAFMGTIYMAVMESGRILLTTVVGGGLALVFNLLLIPVGGAIGAATAILLAFAGLFVVRLVDTRRFVRVSLSSTLGGLALLLIAVQCASHYVAMHESLRLAILGAAWVVLIALFRREVGSAVTLLRHSARRLHE